MVIIMERKKATTVSLWGKKERKKRRRKGILPMEYHQGTSVQYDQVKEEEKGEYALIHS